MKERLLALKEKKYMPKGIKIWNKAKKIIPGGNGLLSKRPDRYLPGLWPTYFKKAKGINIWDLDNNRYIDMAQMGMGSSILGYCNKFVDNKVKKAIRDGVNTTLNSIDEYELAKKILKYNKFADQVKFARGGGEAMSLAVRIARAKSKKDVVAFSGYHGWHDWYLAANLKNKNGLKSHLLPGLSPIGVPKSLSGTVIPFEYNNLKDFKNLNKKKLAAIVIEGCRYFLPNKKFLKEILRVCKRHNICLIIDEITSGWRFTNGGVYSLLNIKPDIVVYGKGLGNGYAISCIVGNKKYMSASDESFMSSTAWTEKVGFAAANATIDFFVKKNVSKHLINNGNLIKKRWIQLANKHNIKLSTSEVSPLCSFFLHYPNNDELYTFFTREMLKYKVIASNSIYLSYAHKMKDIKNYLMLCDKVFKNMSEFIKKKRKINKLKIRYSGFKRLTKG